MKTKLWITLALFLTAPLSQAALMDVEIPHLARYDGSPFSSATEPGKIGFTANLETGETFDWFLIHNGRQIGSGGTARLRLDKEVDYSSWVWFGGVTLSNGYSFTVFESWVPYSSGDLNPFQSIAEGDWLTFRTYFVLDGLEYVSFENPPVTKRIYSVPEPATLSLLALGLAAIGIRRRMVNRTPH